VLQPRAAIAVATIDVCTSSSFVSIDKFMRTAALRPSRR
jgi:hypothetical protein